MTGENINEDSTMPILELSPEQKASMLFNTLKRQINHLSLSTQMKIVGVNDYKKLPPEAQAAILAVVREINL